ncbi:MAG: LysM peptidoglycan-binding domain-containing protein [Flavobacteriaceae bacterium]|nr:LysM peptidoglycan-binding domain-containing protein [Bacteroidia bacterium]NNK26626.1 LysM peptidoglycan-binding domain-containing protein [Flavobacteriaceae bacterium]NNL60212.1 LysM peptidoglycan-binding domain-containing protein [Flavobacteriaceae bacterium]
MKRLLLVLSLLITVSINAQQYKTHQVQEGETIISISKLYKVTPLEIFQLNPDAKQGLKSNTVLLIPKTKVPSANSNTVVTITQELQGFKKHKVRRKETLYSLSKRYNVPQEDIKKYNKWLYAENLRKGDKLQIPIYKEIRKEEIVDNTIQEYIVQQGEGKWRVAYKFGISVEELETLNPDMGDSLKEGQILTVPNIADNLVRTVDETYGYYKVLPREGYYRLKIKLGLTKEELEELNPELKDGGLKDGMILKVPKSNIVLASSGNITGKFSLLDSINDFERKHLVVMLPFELHRVNPDSVYEAKRRIKNRRSLNVSLDFHSGVLMALDSAKRLGISTKLDVYDTRNQEYEVSSIINRNDFSDVDAVIGPLMVKNFNRAASELKRDRIPVISPIVDKVQMYDNVFQTRPSDDMLRGKIIDFVAQDTLVDKVIIVSDSKHKNISSILKGKFPKAKQILSRMKMDKKKKTETDGYYVITEDFEDVIQPGKNVVFLETQDEGFVANVSSMLNSLINIEEKIEIVLMTTNKNSAFEGDNIRNVHLSNLRFHYPTVQKDYDEETNNLFVNQYKDKYGIAPNKFAVRGFDMTLDILLRLSANENLFKGANYDMETEYVENKFNYKKKLFGGYYNEAAYIVKYDNLRLVEAQ